MGCSEVKVAGMGYLFQALFSKWYHLLVNR